MELYYILLAFYFLLVDDTNGQEMWKQWPDGIIPYDIPDTYSETEKFKIRVGMDRWERQTCVKFVPWSEKVHEELGAVRYMNFFRGGSCFSRQGFHKHQPQVIGIGASCFGLQTIVHELGHAIGMKHTMERNDRDNYIEIMYENINPDSRRNYDTTAMKNQSYPYYGTPYDYKSIMHYGPKAYSGNGGITMVTKDPAYNSLIGTAPDVSFYDAMFVNNAYNCTVNCHKKAGALQCLNGGFLGGSDCHCICPDGFTDPYCSTPLPGYDKIVSWKCQKYWSYSSGRCYNVFNADLSYESASALCDRNEAELASFYTESDRAWILPLIKEQVTLSDDVYNFWIGLHRNVNETVYRYRNNEAYDDNIMPIHEMGSSSAEGCVTTDGKSLTGESCEQKTGTRFICMKNFDPSCGGRYTITGRGEYISSPGYPGYYPKLRTCQYTLQTRSGYKIELKFDRFEFEHHASCSADSLQVQLKNDLLDAGQKYCSKALANKTLVSEGNVAILTLTSDASIQKSGFRVYAKAVPELPRPPQPTSGKSLLDILRGLSGRTSSSDDDADNEGRKQFLKSLWNALKSLAISNVL